MNWLINFGISIIAYFVSASFYQSLPEMIRTIDLGGCVFIIIAGAVIATISNGIIICTRRFFDKFDYDKARIFFLFISVVITICLTIAMVYK